MNMANAKVELTQSLERLAQRYGEMGQNAHARRRKLEET
jgi:hypothetical protein